MLQVSDRNLTQKMIAVTCKWGLHSLRPHLDAPGQKCVKKYTTRLIIICILSKALYQVYPERYPLYETSNHHYVCQYPRPASSFSSQSRRTRDDETEDIDNDDEEHSADKLEDEIEWRNVLKCIINVEWNIYWYYLQLCFKYLYPEYLKSKELIYID